MKKLILLLVCGAAALQAAEPSSMIRGTRALGMGDALTAIADDQNVFFYNPAGSVQRTGSLFNFVDLSVTASKDAIDFYQFVNDNEAKLKDYDKLSQAEQKDLVNKINSEMVGLNPTFGATAPNLSFLTGPLFGGFHWGAGVFGQVTGKAGFKPVITVPEMYYDISADVIPAANFSVKIKKLPFVPGSIGVGSNLKYIMRGRVEEKSVSVAALDNYEAPPAQSGRGVAVDIGTLYQPTSRWNVGLAVSDLRGTKIKYDALAAEKGYSAKPAHTEEIKEKWNLGAAWTPGSALGLFSLHDRLVLAADVRDFANKESKIFADGKFADTAGTHFHLGAEYRWLFLRLRTGANQGYFTGGVGLDWPLIKLDYAYYADELSPFAGVSRHPAHRISMTLGFGSGNTVARERIKDSYKEVPEKALEPKTATPVSPAGQASPTPASSTNP